ncbi:carboxymuconolactone decarboxylase family protein [Actinomycetospora atypica]|uniref:Carboxymuconolactone decarboxylase family protein n=1 Tax=Actinomycetospora atypica TaxID=1290095 RepID=A0ABV9YR44_9PSEU
MTTLLTVARLPLRRAIRDVRYVDPVLYGRSRGVVRRVYREVERDFGMLAPPVALHSPAPGLLVAVWELLRATLLVGGETTRAQREAVAAAVSRANQCPYCVEVHDASREQLGGPADVPVENDELLAVRGTFEYLNRMVTVFLPESPLPPAAPEPVRRTALRMLGSAADRPVEPCPVGRSGTELLADVADVADVVLGARLAAAVRGAVYAALARPPGLGDELPADPALHLAVLVAVAPWRVTPEVVGRVAGGDELVVALAAAGAARAAAAVTPLGGSGRAAG